MQEKLHKQIIVTRQELPINRLFPNMVTLMALCSGLSSMRFAFEQRWELSVTFIVLAAFIDLIDGRLARYLQTVSNFGAQLDSLADFFNFTIAPALLLYLWSTKTFPVKGIGWAFVLFFSACGAIRLARFNSELEEPDEDKPAWTGHFFSGIPSTMAGLLALAPLMLSFELDDWPALNNPLFVGIYMSCIAVLMVSRVPTFSTKKLHIRSEHASIIMAISGLLIAGLIIAPWYILPLAGAIYLLLIPISSLIYFRSKKY